MQEQVLMEWTLSAIAAEVSEQLVAQWAEQLVADSGAEWFEGAVLVGFVDNSAAVAFLSAE